MSLYEYQNDPSDVDVSDFLNHLEILENKRYVIVYYYSFSPFYVITSIYLTNNPTLEKGKMKSELEDWRQNYQE